ncbi:MAG: VOC family protein [Nitrososphaerota archaeon]|nr:VOC family protein [Nitrososphaerota archaeon]
MASASILKRFDHVGLAVWSVDNALTIYRDILGGKVTTYKSTGTTNDYLYTQFELAGQRIELIEPVEGKDSFLTKFLKTRGEGMHHLTFQVSDIKNAIEFFKSTGLKTTDEFYEDPVWKTAFISPRSTTGVLIQIYETYPGSPFDRSH